MLALGARPGITHTHTHNLSLSHAEAAERGQGARDVSSPPAPPAPPAPAGVATRGADPPAQPKGSGRGRGGIDSDEERDLEERLFGGSRGGPAIGTLNWAEEVGQDEHEHPERHRQMHLERECLCQAAHLQLIGPSCLGSAPLACIDPRNTTSAPTPPHPCFPQVPQPLRRPSQACPRVVLSAAQGVATGPQSAQARGLGP